MIKVENFVKRFGDTEAVKGVSFTIRPGEITGYLGPNGAGKSTTVKAIVGILKPTEGTIHVCGHDIQREPLEAKRCIGYVPESAAMYSTLTPNEYLSLVSELHDLDHETARDRIGQLLAEFGISEAADRQIVTLSKGMRQKVLLASALMLDPDVFLFDEPLNGLDVNAALTFRRIVQGLAEQGKTILYCSHILDVVERLCQRVIVIQDGLIVADDSTQELLSKAPEGTLEAAFQSLTRRKDADEWIGPFLDAMDAKRTSNSAGK